MIVLALTFALVAPYFIDWTSYRAEFEREAGRILGREVKVEGSATARILPFPSVSFSDVVVAGATPDEPAMTVETFSMDAELAPFMRGELLIFDMRLVRPSVVIDVAKDGMVDWSVRPSVPMDARNISLEKLTITDGTVSLRHEASGRTHALTEVNADISARSLAGPWRMDGSLRLDGMKTAVSVSTGSVDEKGGMRLRVKAQPERYPFAFEADGTARLLDGAADYAGDFRLNASPGRAERTGEEAAVAEKGPPAYRLSGKFDLDHTRIAVDEFRFETGPLEDPYTADGSAEFDLGASPRFAVRADGAQIRFAGAAEGEDGKASFDERAAGFREFVMDLPKPAIPGTVEVQLPAIVAGDTTIRDVSLSAQPSDAGWTIASLGASLPGRTTLEAEGELATREELGFKGSLLLAVGQPSGFAAWLSKDIDEAIRRLPAAGFSAKVDLTERRQLFSDLELMLGSAKFRGEIDNRQPENAKPSMIMRLKGDRLDVEGMTAFASLFVSDKGVNRLADHDLDFEIEAGPVEAAGLEAETVDTALRLRDGQLEIDRLTIGGLAGASVSATGTIKDLSGEPAGDIDATIVSVDLDPLVTAISRRYPQNVAMRELARRAADFPGLLSDARIDAVASIAGNGDGTSGLGINANGEAGGTSFTLANSFKNLRGDLASTPLSLTAKAQNDEAAKLYALLGLPALPLDFIGKAEAEFSLDGVLADGAGTKLAFRGDGLEAGFEGQSTLADDGFFAKGASSITSDDLAPWLMTAGVALPQMSIGLPVDLKAQLDYARGLTVMSGLGGSIAGARVSGDLNAQGKDGVAHLTGSLGIDALDLRLLAEMVLGEQALAGGGTDWSTTPFQQATSLPFTADVDIRAEKLLAGAQAIQDGRMSVRLGPEGVAVSDIGGKLSGGAVSGLVELKNDNGTGLLSAQLQLEEANLATVLGLPGVEGMANISANVTSSGKSLDGLVSALAGSGSMKLRNLVVVGINPAAFQPILAEADKIGRDIDAVRTAGFAPQIATNGAFSAAGADLALTIANGVVRAPPLRLETPGAVLSADVGADLGTSAFSANAAISYDPGQEALAGSEPAVRFRVEGTRGDVQVSVDTEPLAQFLTQRALEREQERVEAMQASLLEKQRYRREARYYQERQEARVRAAEEERRAAEEAEEARLEAEAHAKREAEAAEQRRLAEEERTRQAEEEARQKAEAEAKARAEEEARAKEEKRLRQENEKLRAEVEALMKARETVGDPLPAEMERAPIPAPRGGNAPPERAAGRAAGEGRSDLPGVSDIFSERNMSIDGLLRSLDTEQ
ncbi:AsmA-like C-terminal region-containing protein [Aquamicrobium sp. LC103]|uniref:AsmA-like C-terminal region-containing protein n=1 Tax=Aquamicrobium sp. LC103 TaxID=1120658 RepID=UPI001FEE4AFE|nr:AsmA-like C-terminal region-containing protein [Aquamicrobium sp. LC103]